MYVCVCVCVCVCAGGEVEDVWGGGSVMCLESVAVGEELHLVAGVFTLVNE